MRRRQCPSPAPLAASKSCITHRPAQLAGAQVRAGIRTQRIQNQTHRLVVDGSESRRYRYLVILVLTKVPGYVDPVAA